ncbi:hypothetical protein ACH5RR_035408 [Cinchona calisaya]|uniref:Transposase MuDR plant domain-containing protein n=1 Tax=Cinchona calisaya TaxID=153742 RepID=A0ABD2Y584_9GENT
MSIVLHCDIPETGKIMEISSDDHVMQMFEFHKRDEFINLYVGPVHANGNHDSVNIDNYNDGNENTKKVMNRKIGNKPRSKTRRSSRLANGKRKASIGTSEIENGLVDDNMETDDNLYAFTGDDEMGADCDDEFYSRMVTNELENDSENSGVLSGYESNDYTETENDLDSDFENDIMGSYLNVDEFTIPEREKFKLLQGMIFADVYSFRKTLFEYAFQWGFPLIKNKNEKCRVIAHCGSEGCE